MLRIFTSQPAIEWATASLVFLVALLAGHQAQLGMTLLQWAGAAAAILGSITLAVAVRVWPAPGADPETE